MWSLPAAKRAIVVAGCLAMAYTQLTMSPATIQYAREFNASAFHIGVLGALPTGMLFLQFVAAVAANHLKHRRRLWMSVSLVQRLICVPVAVGPLVWPEVPDLVWVWSLIAVTAANHGMLHFSTPLWLSWMGDYLPRDGLSRYWGVRHLWMQWTAAGSLLAGSLLLLYGGLEIRPAFAVLVGAGAVFGVADILLFLKVDEPPVQPAGDMRLKSVLTEPFRDRTFRSFIGFTCFWYFAAMTGAPFITLYLLERVGMRLDLVLLLWTCSWIGGAAFSGRFGRLTEDYGNRPVLILCMAFKSLNMIALLLIPADPRLAFWILVPVFMIDAVLNSGIAIANNGFMLKNSPAENRTMFIAAGTAAAGMVGGLTSIAAGAVLVATEFVEFPAGALTVSNFHLMFALSLMLRLVAALLARRIREPKSHDTVQVVTLLVGVTPLRIMRYPLGLYRSVRTGTVGEKRRRKRAKID